MFSVFQTREAAEKFRVLADDGAELFAGAVDAGFDGAGGGLANAGGFVVGVGEDIDEDDGAALVEGELHEGVLECGGDGRACGAFFGRFLVVGDLNRGVECVEYLFERACAVLALVSAEFVLALVGRDAEEPAAEVSPFEAGNGTVGGKEGLLRRVLGGLAVTEEPKAEVKDRGLVALDKAVEGVKISVF